MSDFAFLNRYRVRSGDYASDDSFGFTGKFVLPWGLRDAFLCVVSSDGGGWQHVSVSLVKSPQETPTWQMMCVVKDKFFEPEDCVVQFHPPASEYVNHHPGCLHLWRCIDGREQPRPPAEFVGPKTNQPNHHPSR